MAAPACNNHPDTPATFIGTFMETGDALAVCGSCLVTFSLGMLQALTGIDATPLLEAVSSDTTEPGTPEGYAGNPEPDPEPDLAAKPSPNGKAGHTRPKSRAAGTVDARSDEERAETGPEPAVADA